MTQHNILSPDNISIRQENFKSKEEAITYFEDVWKPRFKSQGYYSSNNGRIPLDELDCHCEFEKIEL